ncbi:hypothetical protein AgCh_009638 [Apium graveolens]
MKEVTFKNVKCKTGGLIPRKGDARTSMLSLPNQERKADDHCYLLEAIWIDLNLNKDAIMKLGKAKEVADTLKDEVVKRKMLGPAVVQRTKDMIDLIRRRLVVAQDGHDKYVDLTRKDKGPSNVIGIPWKRLMRFGKKGKLSLQFVGPLDILRRLGS